MPREYGPIAGAALIAMLLAGCAAAPREPITLIRTVETKVPVRVRCEPPAVPPTMGPDYPTADMSGRERVDYAVARIMTLRGEVDALRDWIDVCNGENESGPQ